MNVSLSGSDIYIKSGRTYFVIDALYLEEIRNELSRKNENEFEDEIKKNIFPYTKCPFAKIVIENKTSSVEKLEVVRIKKVEDENINSNCFSTDTGLIVVIEDTIFLDFLHYYDYNNLVIPRKIPIDIDYWEQIEKKFPEYYCGLILAPDVNSKFDFNGSGQFKVDV